MSQLIEFIYTSIRLALSIFRRTIGYFTLTCLHYHATISSCKYFTRKFQRVRIRSWLTEKSAVPTNFKKCLTGAPMMMLTFSEHFSRLRGYLIGYLCTYYSPKFMKLIWSHIHTYRYSRTDGFDPNDEGYVDHPSRLVCTVLLHIRVSKGCNPVLLIIKNLRKHHPMVYGRPRTNNERGLYRVGAIESDGMIQNGTRVSK